MFHFELCFITVKNKSEVLNVHTQIGPLSSISSYHPIYFRMWLGWDGMGLGWGRLQLIGSCTSSISVSTALENVHCLHCLHCLQNNNSPWLSSQNSGSEHVIQVWSSNSSFHFITCWFLSGIELHNEVSK